jgi:hypothetical protein
LSEITGTEEGVGNGTAGKKEETIELMELVKSGIRVAAYMMELPPRELLKKMLHEAMLSAQTRIEQKRTKGINRFFNTSADFKPCFYRLHLRIEHTTLSHKFLIMK